MTRRTAPYAACTALGTALVWPALVSALLWLAVAVPAAHADPEPPPGKTTRAGTGVTGAGVDKTRARLLASERELSKLVATKAALDKQYQAQLAEIDRLKQQRASWRRDRAIRSHMSESHGTANELAALDQKIRRRESTIRSQRQALVAAIERELAHTPNPVRRTQLLGWQKEAKRGLRREAKKIVLPEDTIDPLADPEELEYQASLLRQGEAELARELARLDEQAKHYRHMAALRQKYQRADEFSRFDDDRPRRASGSSGTRSQGESGDLNSPPSGAPPPNQQDAPSPGGDDLGGAIGDDPMFDVVLADVVDATTIRALQAAELSSDPAVKAKAAETAREQVKQRLERLEKRRREMQERARSLQETP